MNIRIINNESEYSRSVTRDNGMTLDICAFKKEREFVVAVVNEDDIHVQEVAFSKEELAVLMQHLSDPIVHEILGEQEIVGVRCPNCGYMISSFINHPCKG